MRGFDVVTKEDEGDEQVIYVGLVNREEDQWSVVLKQRKDRK